MTVNILCDGQIRLRAVEPSDALAMYDIENDASIWSYSRQQAPLSMRAIAEYAAGYDADPMRSGQLRLIVESVGDGEICGIADLYGISPLDRHAWVGIVILPEYRRRGIARAALTLLAHYSGKILNLRILGAKIAADNGASLRLFASSGFTHSGTLPGWITAPDGSVALALLAKQLL